MLLVSSTKHLAATASDDRFNSSMLCKRSNRPLLLAFLGTDWSISSLKLDREVFDQAAFADNSKYNFLLCKIHFLPKPKSGTRKSCGRVGNLAYNIISNQFLRLVLSPHGAEIGRVGYIRRGGKIC